MDDFDEAISQRANIYQSDNDFSRMEALRSDEDEFDNVTDSMVPEVALAPARKMARISSQRPSDVFNVGVVMQPDSSAATAGEASGYSSSGEESA